MKRNVITPLLFVSTNLAATALAVVTALLSTNVFASGYGPQPSYEPILGAPASQRGPSIQTLAAKSNVAVINADAEGGTYDTHVESGGPARSDNRQLLNTR